MMKNKVNIEIIGFDSIIMALVDDYDIIRKFDWIIDNPIQNYRTF